MKPPSWKNLARSRNEETSLRLVDGSRVGVVGGGPAGSFFAYFLLDMAERVGLHLDVEIYEPRDFSIPAPKGCNMCGGIVSESLVQTLAAEGINLPSSVVQRGIDSYMLHMDVGSVRIETPLNEKRIAAVYRGPGPRDVREIKWRSFDGYLQELAVRKGASIIPERVTDVRFADGRPHVIASDSVPRPYDLAAIAVGVNTSALKQIQQSDLKYSPPQTTKTLIREYYFGEDLVQQTIGSSMHVFLLNIPRLDFAAIIPKGDYVTVCLLGESIDKALVQSFLGAPEVRKCFPIGWDQEKNSCQCGPFINVRAARTPFANRIVFIGDSGATRLYKDGIGAAYRTAKAAATTAVFQGISADSFQRHYGPICRSITADNALGRVTFLVTRLIQRTRSARRAVWRMTVEEQKKEGHARRMSQVLWDMFTGSAPYRDVFLRTLHPAFLGRLLVEFVSLNTRGDGVRKEGETDLETGKLGKVYEDGETILRQGEVGDCMYVIQEGQAEAFVEREGQEVPLRMMGEGEIIGEMALFDREVRSATVRARGRVRALTVDRTGLLRRIQQDPTLALHIIETMSRRIRQLSNELAQLKQ